MCCVCRLFFFLLDYCLCLSPSLPLFLPACVSPLIYVSLFTSVSVSVSLFLLLSPLASGYLSLHLSPCCFLSTIFLTCVSLLLFLNNLRAFYGSCLSPPLLRVSLYPTITSPCS